MALGADFNADFGLGGAGVHNVAASTANDRGAILRLDTVFHCIFTSVSFFGLGTSPREAGGFSVQRLQPASTGGFP